MKPSAAHSIALATLGGALALKLAYSRAGASDLGWVLTPSCYLARLAGVELQHESSAGYISHAHHLVVGPACAGVNFLITAWLALHFCVQGALRGPWRKLGWSAASLVIAYAVSVLANGLRISLAALLFQLDIYTELLTKARVHALLGVVLYCSCLLIVCQLAAARARGESQLPAASLARRAYAIYLAVVLGLPLLHRAFQPDPQRFLEHALLTAGAGGLVLAAFSWLARGTMMRTASIVALCVLNLSWLAACASSTQQHQQRSTAAMQPLAAEPLRARPEREPAPTYGAVPQPSTLTYLGVAGWSLSDGSSTLLFDPYVTRAPLTSLDEVALPDAAAIERYTPEHVDLIAVSHTHFDHALDVPSIAWRTGAHVLGTTSLANLARASGLPEQQIHAAHGGEDLRFGAFLVRVVPALHSVIDLPNAPIAPGLKLPLRARDYHEGGTLQYFVRFAGHAVYFVGTANFVEAELHDMRPDIAIVAVGLRHKVPDYTCRLLRALGLPARVLVNHFDAFQQPFGPDSVLVSPETEADLAAFEAEVHACAPATRVEVPVHLMPIAL